MSNPTGKKVIGSKWVLRIKTNAAANIDKSKARVVAKGYGQVEGINCDETFAPTVRFESIRTLIVMGVAEGWNFEHMDDSTSLLYADLEQQLQVGLGIDREGLGVLLLCDNQSSIRIAQYPVFHKRSKHIAIRYHFIREKVEGGGMELQFVRTKEMAADQLTKNAVMQILVAGKDFMGIFSG